MAKTTRQRTLLHTLVLCCMSNGLTGQPITDLCTTDDVNSEQLLRTIASLRAIGERQVSLMEQILSTQRAFNERQQALIEQDISTQSEISGRQMSLLEQIHCALLTSDKRGKESNLADVKCRQSVEGSRTCYKVIREAVNWHSAREYCRSYNDGVDLVSIESAEERDFLAQFLIDEHGICTSFHTSGRMGSDGVWKWTATGHPFDFTSWAGHQPDNTGDYCYIWNRSTGWNTWDDYIDDSRCILCEYDTKTPPYCQQ